MKSSLLSSLLGRGGEYGHNRRRMNNHKMRVYFYRTAPEITCRLTFGKSIKHVRKPNNRTFVKNIFFENNK
jgi:hypothetical protein